ncbi:class I SAM-dependent methyltransferase [Limnohabitans sp. Bal53]|uniref:class I SAM-dependent methyltransferase n=1 Tax=Limnohabitans sp. Bal53 TaxID=1977910 RepID=UPI000D3C26A6
MVQRLPASVRDANAPLLLVCEGVLMYLTPTQVKAVLQEIGENAPEGSELVCDFMTPLCIGLWPPACRAVGRSFYGVPTTDWKWPGCTPDLSCWRNTRWPKPMVPLAVGPRCV